jgi:hypothetical protein
MTAGDCHAVVPAKVCTCPFAAFETHMYPVAPFTVPASVIAAMSYDTHDVVVVMVSEGYCST